MSRSNKSAGYESEVYTVSGGLKHGFGSCERTTGLVGGHDALTIDEGEGEGDEPIKQKCRVRK